jgi:hypothetical protein
MADLVATDPSTLRQLPNPADGPIVVSNGLELLGCWGPGVLLPLPLPSQAGVCLVRSCGWGYVGPGWMAATADHTRTTRHPTIYGVEPSAADQPETNPSHR